MTKTRRTYTDEFKREAIRLLESSGKSARQLERELGIGKTCLSRWKRELEEKGKQAFPGQGHVPLEREQVQELERQVEILRQERDILKKAVAIFARPSR
jgi:transposase